MTALKKLRGVYHARINTNGRTKYLSTNCTTRDEAERVLAESGVAGLQLAAKAGQLTTKTIGQLLTGKHLTCATALAKYKAVKAISKSAKTVANNVLVIGNWMQSVDVANLPPSAVKPHHIGNWINNPALPWKRSTRQVALASVRTFFEFCASQGWIASDPSQLVALDYSVMSHEQKESHAKVPFTEAEIARLIEGLKQPKELFWLVAVMTAKETGLRLSDIAQLEWRSFEGCKLVVWAEKTNKRSEHEISEALQNLVGEIPVMDATYVFPEQRNIIRDLKRRASLSMAFKRICVRLKIVGKSFHSLRHTKAHAEYDAVDKDALAKRLAESLTVEQIAALLGHSNTATTKGYLGQ